MSSCCADRCKTVIAVKTVNLTTEKDSNTEQTNTTDNSDTTSSTVVTNVDNNDTNYVTNVRFLDVTGTSITSVTVLPSDDTIVIMCNPKAGYTPPVSFTFTLPNAPVGKLYTLCIIDTPGIVGPPSPYNPPNIRLNSSVPASLYYINSNGETVLGTYTMLSSVSSVTVQCVGSDLNGLQWAVTDIV